MSHVSSPAIDRAIRAWVVMADVLVVACSFIACAASYGQIVSSATGAINLELTAFFDGYPDQVEVIPIGLNDTNPSIDGTGYYSASGLGEVEYNVLTVGHGQMWFNVVTSSDSEDGEIGGGGNAGMDVSLYVQAPFYYRFEADALRCYASYQVSFNNLLATASWDIRDAEAEGTFPIVYEVDPPDYSWPVGWDTHVDEGFLPAGVYTLSTKAWASFYRAYGGLTMGDARLMIQLQGDTDSDGFVGIDDLNVVLANWNDHVPAGLTTFGDIDHDGFVGIDDLNLVLGNWNADVRPSSIVVPEPATASMLMLVGVMVRIPGRSRCRR